MTDENADLTAETNQEQEDEQIDNDLDTLPSEDESIEGEDESTEEEKKPDEKDTKIQNLERQLRTSSRKYDKATRDINKLRGIQQKPKEDKTLTDEEKKDKKAEEWVDQRVEAKLKEQETARKEKETEAVEALKDELDDVLLENEDLTEDQILTFIEDMNKRGVAFTPTQAASLIKEGFEKKQVAQKPKPKLPVSKRGSGEVDLAPKGEKEKKKLTYHERFAGITNAAKKIVQGQK